MSLRRPGVEDRSTGDIGGRIGVFFSVAVRTIISSAVVVMREGVIPATIKSNSVLEKCEQPLFVFCPQ